MKANYDWRLYSLHRAQEAGIDDVAIGVLFGLYNWKFEVLGLLMLSRLAKARAAGVPITNYGVAISLLQGVLPRVLGPFPAALQAYKDEAKR